MLNLVEQNCPKSSSQYGLTMQITQERTAGESLECPQCPCAAGRAQRAPPAAFVKYYFISETLPLFYFPASSLI